MAYRILVTGSRTWTDDLAIGAALADLTRGHAGVVVVHGGARGADASAARWAARKGHTVEEHLADWEGCGKRAGMIRNAAMVKAGADLCVAFIRDNSRGATACAEMARAAGIRTVVITWEQRGEELPLTKAPGPEGRGRATHNYHKEDET